MAYTIEAGKAIDDMTDLEFLNHWVETDNGFIDPFLFRDAQRRGVVGYLDYLNGTKEERRAQLYARLAAAGKVFGDPEIDAIAGAMDMLKKLRSQLNAADLSDAVAVRELLRRMDHQAEYVQTYFAKS